MNKKAIDFTDKEFRSEIRSGVIAKNRQLKIDECLYAYNVKPSTDEYLDNKIDSAKKIIENINENKNEAIKKLAGVVGPEKIYQTMISIERFNLSETLFEMYLRNGQPEEAKKWLSVYCKFFKDNGISNLISQIINEAFSFQPENEINFINNDFIWNEIKTIADPKQINHLKKLYFIIRPLMAKYIDIKLVEPPQDLSWREEVICMLIDQCLEKWIEQIPVEEDISMFNEINNIEIILKKHFNDSYEKSFEKYFLHHASIIPEI
jgi:hypothetical protein